MKIAEKLSYLSALEEETIAKKQVSPELKAKIAESREQIATILDKIREGDAQSHIFQPFLTLYDRYNTSLKLTPNLKAPYLYF